MAKGKMTKSKAKKALGSKQKKEVRKIVKSTLSSQAEDKFHEQNEIITVSSGGQVHRLDAIAVGTTQNERIGNTIRFKKMVVRQEFTVGDEFNIMRTIFFVWKEQSVPNTASILSATQTNTPWLANYNYSQRKNYTILSDRLTTLFKGGDSIARTRNYTKRWKNGLKSVLEGDTSTSLSTNANLWVLNISDSGVNPSPQYRFAMHLFYEDF